MADGHFPTLVSKDRNANSATNTIFTSVSDGTDTLAVNADGSLNVTVTGGASNTQFAEDAAHVSGDIGTEVLTVRRDTPVSGTSADGDYATLNTDANGRLYTTIHDGGNSITVDGAVTVSATDLDIRDLTHVSDSVKVGDGTDFLAVAADGSIAVTDNGGSLTVDGTIAVSSVGGTVTVAATDLDIRDLTLAQDAVKVSANTSANSQTNPIFVQNVENAITGEVHDYNTAAAVASDATSNHDYTVTTNLKLKKITVASSGGSKFEVQVGPVASLVSKRVGFLPKDGGYTELTFDPPIEVPNTSTGTVRVIRTNRQGAAQDLYSSIEGIDN